MLKGCFRCFTNMSRSRFLNCTQSKQRSLRRHTHTHIRLEYVTRQYCIMHKYVCFMIIYHLTCVCRWFKQFDMSQHSGQFPAGLWNLGYLYNQRYPYVEVVIRINLISNIASYTPHPKPSFHAPPVAPSPQTAAMPWATRPSPPPLQRPCWRTPRRDTSRREGTNTIATDHLRFEDTISGKTQHGCGCPEKMDMWKTYSCHNMYFFLCSATFLASADGWVVTVLVRIHGVMLHRCQ